MMHEMGFFHEENSIIPYLECRCLYRQTHNDLQDTAEFGSGSIANPPILFRQPHDIVSPANQYRGVSETISGGCRSSTPDIVSLANQYRGVADAAAAELDSIL